MPYAGPTHKPPGAYKRDYRREGPGDPFCSSWRWRKARKMFLRRHPLCANPHGIHTEPVPATDVDHIKPRCDRPDLSFDFDNLQSLCKQCHSIKTASERRSSVTLQRRP